MPTNVSRLANFKIVGVDAVFWPHPTTLNCCHLSMSVRCALLIIWFLDAFMSTAVISFPWCKVYPYFYCSICRV